eukprot:6742078-Prorocentrum_lima.AAC.1
MVTGTGHRSRGSMRHAAWEQRAEELMGLHESQNVQLREIELPPANSRGIPDLDEVGPYQFV